MNIIKLDKLLLTILTNGVNVIIENRDKPGFEKYDTLNHCEIIDKWNISDLDLWDGIILGYDKEFPFKKIYKTKKLMGVILLEDNNHKIILKLSNRGFSKKRYKQQLKKYMENYEYINKLNCTYINLNDEILL